MLKNIVLIITLVISFILINAGYGQQIVTPTEPMAFLYEEIKDEDTGEKIIVRNVYPLSEKERKDEEGINKLLTELQSKTSGQQNVDLRSVAAWMYFKDQLEKWEKYMGEIVFRRAVKSETLKIKWDTKDNVQTTLNEIFQDLQTQAQEISTGQHDEVVGIVDGLDNRENQRIFYQNWLDDQKKTLEEFAKNWIQRKTGVILSIDGNNYLISAKPLERLPRDHYNVVSPSGYLTPYDFLNPDGTFKKPQE